MPGNARGRTREGRWLEYWSQPIRSGLYAGGRIEQYMDITRRKELEFKEHEQRNLSEALASTAIALTSTLDMDEVLAGILANVERVIPHDMANVMLVERGKAHVAGRRGYNATDLAPEGALHVGVHESPLLTELANERQAVILNKLSTVTRGPVLTAYGIARSYLGVPIVALEQLLGFLNIFSFSEDFFTAEHAFRAEAFAAQAAAAIQNAHHFRQSKEIAVTEERQRLARELHELGDADAVHEQRDDRVGAAPMGCQPGQGAHSRLAVPPAHTGCARRDAAAAARAAPRGAYSVEPQPAHRAACRSRAEARVL